MFAQISVSFDFSKHQCGVRKGYSTQHRHLKMLEKWKKCLAKGKVFIGLRTGLSKAFNGLDHELLTVKLNAYSFNLPASLVMHDYLPNRSERIKIENAK